MRRLDLDERVDVSTLVLFRILFGLLLTGELLYVWHHARTDFPAVEFRPAYSLLPWTRSLPQPDLDLFAPLMLAALAGLTLGLLTRFAAAVFTLVYVYVFLLDPSHFNNHYYLIALLGACFVVVRSNGEASLDSLFRGRSPTVPRWQLALLQGHFALAYFYGGLAKLNGDWLRGEPVRMWLDNVHDHPLLGVFARQPWSDEFIAWTGLTFDLAIPYLLLSRHTRAFGIGLTFVFHLTNTQLFNIGVFPYLGLAANVLFLHAGTPRRWVQGFTGQPSSEPATDGTADVTPPPQSSTRRFLLPLLVVYSVFHLVFPFRHWLCRGHVEWTEEAKRFSWRMMLSYKDTHLEIEVRDKATGRRWEVDQMGLVLASLGAGEVGTARLVEVQGRRFLIPSRFLSVRQQSSRGIEGDPRLLKQWCEFLADEARRLGIREPAVHCRAVCALNGRPYQFLVDPDVDLAAEPVPTFGTPRWVVPLALRQPIGDYPLADEDRMARIRALIEGHDSTTADSRPARPDEPEPRT